MADEKLTNRFGVCGRCGALIEPGCEYCDDCASAILLEQQNPSAVPSAAEPSFAICARCGEPIKPGSEYCDVCKRVIVLERQKETENQTSYEPPVRQRPSQMPSASHEPLPLGAEDDAHPGMTDPSEIDMQSMNAQYENKSNRRISPTKIIVAVVLVAVLIGLMVRFGVGNVFQYIAWFVVALFLRRLGFTDDDDYGYGYGSSRGSFFSAIIFIFIVLIIFFAINHIGFIH
jgi:uncharacterized Zn finger protein (UPF0148 family)